MTGRYKAYPDYKSSGVFWLDKIPSNWTINTVKRLTDFQVGWTPPTGNDKNFVGDNLWANISDLKDKYLHNTAKNISDEAARLASMDITPKGSLLYSFKLSVGSVSFAQQDMYTNEAIASFLSSSKLPLEYLYYSLPIFVIQNASTNIYGARILNQELIKNAFLLEPSYKEAEKIANFLDHETAKIDTLITKQEKLIELLKEKLLANRYHTVTKGLNPDVSFVETGISWTPLAPEHWSQVPNRSVMSMRRVLVGQKYRNYQLLSLTKKGVLVRNISSGEGKQSDHLDRTQEVRKGDLVFCLFDVEETPRTVGLSHHLGMISGDYTVFECSNPNMARFLEYFYKAMDDRKLLKPLYRGLRKRIPKPGFLRVSIPVPPKEELESILQSLDYLEERIEQLTQLADKQVTILKERKTALISAAVTGKIDVREWEAK
ncbi:restriction endonuclease subunit S [Vibrio lentus]